MHVHNMRVRSQMTKTWEFSVGVGEWTLGVYCHFGKYINLCTSRLANVSEKCLRALASEIVLRRKDDQENWKEARFTNTVSYVTLCQLCEMVWVQSQVGFVTGS